MTQKTKTNNILVFIGIILITVLLWNRFRIRLPKNFIDFSFYFVILMIIISLIICLYSIKLLYKPTKSSIISKAIIHIYSNQNIVRVLDIIQKILDSPKSVFEKINHSLFMKKYGKKIGFYTEIVPYKLSIWRKDKSKTIFYVLPNIVPKVIVSSLFIIDILFFYHIKYFYFSLVILILPMIINCLRYIIKESAQDTLKYLNAHLRFFDVNLETLEYKVQFKDKIPDIEDAKDIITHQGNKELLEWFLFNFERYSDIVDFLDEIKKEEEFYKPYENIFVYGCYLIGWLYILFIAFL